MGTILAEEDFLTEVLKDSTFADFYRHAKSKLSKPIKWIIETPKEQQQKKGFAQAEDNSIHFDHIPDTDESCVVAHEVMHLVLSLLEGYPSLECLPYPQDCRMSEMAGSIVTILQDALIDSRLVNYGFNVKSFASDYEIDEAIPSRQKRPSVFPIEERVENVCQQFGRNTGNSSASHIDDNKIVVLLHVFFISNYSLRYTVDMENEDLPESTKIYAQKNPGIATEAYRLIAKIKYIGYDTPEQHYALLNHILKYYDLSSYLRIRNYS